MLVLISRENQQGCHKNPMEAPKENFLFSFCLSNWMDMFAMYRDREGLMENLSSEAIFGFPTRISK